MRVAYLLMVHDDPDQVAAVLAALPVDSPVFVHVDARTSTFLYRRIAALSDQRPFQMVRRYRCYWGRIGMVLASLALVRAALRSDGEWGYASLLSGACYPIKSNEEISAALDRRAPEELVVAWDMAGPNPWSAAGGRFQAAARTRYRYVGAGRRILRLPGSRTVPYGLKPHGGPQWWTLSRGALEYVDRFIESHPRYLRFMRGVFIPDECFYQTLLAASPFRDRISGDSSRFVEWDRPGPPWPAVLTSEDLESLRSTDAFYARKFSRKADARVFALIESELRGGRASD